MKTFNDLIFGQHINNCIKDTKQARMQFDNGYGISVLLGGEGIYSNGIDTYEVAILYDDELCYDSGLCDDIFAHRTQEEITKLMEKIQQLPNKNTEKVVTLTLGDITLLQKSVSNKVEELECKLQRLMRDLGYNKNSIFFKEINKEIAKYSEILERLK
jgi:hypothetical protein